jgi:hypothetical protein
MNEERFKSESQNPDPSHSEGIRHPRKFQSCFGEVRCRSRVGHRPSALGFRRRSERDGGLGSQVQKCERLLEVETHGSIRVAQVANGDVLADVQVKIAAASGDDEGAGDGGRKNNFIFDETLDVLEHRISVIACFSESGVGIGAEECGIGAVHADQTQLIQGVSDDVGVFADIRGEFLVP